MAEEIFGAHAVEATVGGEESVGGEDVKARVEDEVVAEGADGDEDVGAERAEGRAVFCLVGGEEVVPAVVDELPQGGYPGDAWLADESHNCSNAQFFGPWEKISDVRFW